MTKRRSIRKRPEPAQSDAPARSRRIDRPLRVLVTAGPTHEPIDRVRFIGNRSSGAMGIAIAEAAAASGAACTLLLGPTSRSTADTSIRTSRFQTTADLQALLGREFPHCDVLIMAAAVADYRPRPSKGGMGKIPRRKEGMLLQLESTPDLLAALSKIRKTEQTIVGFALEPKATMKARAGVKLARKGLDLIVANPLETMESPKIRAVVLSSTGVVLEQRQPVNKARFAHKLTNFVLRWHRAATLN